MAKRRPTPNYYQRRDAKARRDAARRAAARSPEAIADRLLAGLDLDGIAHTLTEALERRDETEAEGCHNDPHEQSH